MSAPDDHVQAVTDAVRRIYDTVATHASTGEPAPDDTVDAAIEPSWRDERGLHGKYHVIRVDRQDDPGGKHHGCTLFVLDLTHDPAARAAVLAYMAVARPSRPVLVADLAAVLDDLDRAPS